MVIRLFFYTETVKTVFLSKTLLYSYLHWKQNSPYTYSPMITIGTKYLKIGFIQFFTFIPSPALASALKFSQPHWC